MSVYTTVSEQALTEFLQDYAIGDLVSLTGISDGIENTNYFVETTQGKYVLTLFEALSAEELPFFLDLMAHLNEHQVPSAHPIADNDQHYLKALCGKPAALVQRLTGKSVLKPNNTQCAALGRALGHAHVVTSNFTGIRTNRRGPHWWQQTAEKLLPHLSTAQKKLLEDELAFQTEHRNDNLPRGTIHADLFRDNALFNGDMLTGIIDFYYACTDVLLYDVAVTVNDWCTNNDGSLNAERCGHFLQAYQKERTLSDAEKVDWPLMLRAAALRFWLSRLQDKHFPREGEMTHIKDPQVFEDILIDRRVNIAQIAN